MPSRRCALSFKAVTTYGNRDDADEACRKGFRLAHDRPEATSLYIQAAQSWMCQKASADPHEYKFLAAILEETQSASPEWQPYLLAASVHFLHGKRSPDYPAVQQAREALQKLTPRVANRTSYHDRDLPRQWATVD